MHEQLIEIRKSENVGTEIMMLSKINESPLNCANFSCSILWEIFASFKWAVFEH